MQRVLAGALVALVLCAPAAAQEEPARIAAGTSVAGIDVSGRTVPGAASLLRSELAPAVLDPIEVRVADHVETLDPRELGARLDPAASARRALRAELPGNLAPVVRYRREAVRAYVVGLRDRVAVEPRDATLRITVHRMIRKRSYGGRRLRERQLLLRIVTVLREPLRDRVVRATRRRVEADVTWHDLPRVYPTVLTVDRTGFRLRLFKNLVYDRSYPIAVGAAGYDTPTGLFTITSRQVNPAWTAPNRPWAGSYAGRTIPGGAPDNPLKARWLGVTGAVGIHGTAEPWSMGTRASHGCIRMLVPDVIDLFPRVPLGTPVLIR